MLIVSVETHDRMAAVSVRPSNENRQTTARSGETVENAVGRPVREWWALVRPGHERH
jgi:hypothetical protein